MAVVDVGAPPPDGDGLRGFARGVEDRHGPLMVRAAVESMNGARFVHDTLERCGWEVEVADAQKVKGLGTRDRLGARLHHRRGDRRHRSLRLTEEAHGLHRPVPRVYQSGVARELLR